MTEEDLIKLSLTRFDENLKAMTAAFEKSAENATRPFLNANAGGLVATLAFAGATYGDYFEIYRIIPFLAAMIFFAVGLISSMVAGVLHYWRLHLLLNKYVKVIQSPQFTNLIKENRALNGILAQTRLEIFLNRAVQWSWAVCFFTFLGGMSAGLYQLYNLF